MDHGRKNSALIRVTRGRWISARVSRRETSLRPDGGSRARRRVGRLSDPSCAQSSRVKASHRASRVTVGVADHPDAARAARAATEQALRDGPATTPACALLFSTSRHDPGELLTAVRAGLGADVPIYGGWAVGIISADMLGYDGFQIGMALFWLEDAEVNVLVGRGLAGNEERGRPERSPRHLRARTAPCRGERSGRARARRNESAVGRDLIDRLRTNTFRGNPSLLLLYDSVNRTGNALRLNMATPLLEGHFSRLPEDIPLAGAGLVGDMQCRSTYQWTGSEVETQAALLFAFSGNIEIEPVVVHGCRAGERLPSDLQGRRQRRARNRRPAGPRCGGRPARRRIGALVAGLPLLRDPRAQQRRAIRALRPQPLCQSHVHGGRRGTARDW